MLVALDLPVLNPLADVVTVPLIHAKEGDRLDIGSKILDVQVDLSAAAPHDCPPISNYTITSREQLWLRRLLVAKGDELRPNARLAVLTTEPTTPLDEPPSRKVRISVVSMMGPPGW